MDYSKLPSKDIVQKTMKELNNHGINAFFVETIHEAKLKVLNLIPEGSEVMTASSETLEATGIAHEINDTGKFDSVKNALMSMDRDTQGLMMQKLGAAPEFVVGSVHAVTEDGKILIASKSGSQLPAYSFGSAHVVWVVGIQKIVKDIKEAKKRIEEYVLPLESERAHKAYGLQMPASAINKLLIINSENPGRINLIFVNEVLGY